MKVCFVYIVNIQFFVTENPNSISDLHSVLPGFFYIFSFNLTSTYNLVCTHVTSPYNTACSCVLHLRHSYTL